MKHSKFSPVSFTFVVGGVGLLAVWLINFDILGKNTVPAFEHSVAALEAPDVAQVRGEIREGVNVPALIKPTEAVLAEGKTIYSAQCSACHGADGAGIAAMGSRNFTSTEGWTNGVSFAEVFISLTEGVNAMPAYGTLPVADRAALVHFIQSLAEYPTPGASDVQSLNAKYQLSDAKQDKSTVPLAVAANVLTAEAKAEADAIAALSAKISADKVISEYVTDADKLATVLVRTSAWKSSSVELAKMLVLDPASYGVSAGIAGLSSTEWFAVHGALK